VTCRPDQSSRSGRADHLPAQRCPGQCRRRQPAALVRREQDVGHRDDRAATVGSPGTVEPDPHVVVSVLLEPPAEAEPFGQDDVVHVASFGFEAAGRADDEGHRPGWASGRRPAHGVRDTP